MTTDNTVPLSDEEIAELRPCPVCTRNVRADYFVEHWRFETERRMEEIVSVLLAARGLTVPLKRMGGR